MTHRPIFEPLESGKVVFLPDLPAEAFAPLPSDPAAWQERTGDGLRQDRVSSLLVNERSDLASAFALSAPLALTALAMGLPVLAAPRMEIGALSLSYLLVLLVLAAGYSFARLRGEPLDVAAWTSASIAVAILTPLIAVQTELVRTPYVGGVFGTLRPVTLLTIGVLVVLVGLALLAALGTGRRPEQADFVFVFPAMIVPTISGVPHPVSQTAIVSVVAAVSGFAAVVVLLGRTIRQGQRAFVCPIAMGLLIGALMATGRSLVFAESSGKIVRALPLLLLGAAILLLVATPLMAMYARAVVSEMSRRDISQS
ncbi:MAG: hypothetical protein M3R06_04545 [Chloroflexota bacterium]|nr:hypothetical protein [Chloroflexota bacterium]